MLIETWNKKYSPTPTKQITGVLSVSFLYRRALGPRSEAGELTVSISGGAGEPTYKSKVVWPQDNYESQVIEGITDAMYQFSQAPLAVSVTLEKIGWDEIHSSGNGFYFAAREATLSAFRILGVRRGQDAQQVVPGDAPKAARP